MIASFSWRHKEHLFVMLEYAFAVRKTFHVRADITFFFFHFPYITRKSSAVGIKFYFITDHNTFFKLSFSQSKIYFFRVTSCCCTFVLTKAICLNSTLAIKRVSCVSFWIIFLLYPSIICHMFEYNYSLL